MNHRWSGWPGAWCLDCGLEDANELALAGPPEEVHHRYSEMPHTAQPCGGCSKGPCAEPGSHNHDPYYHRPVVEIMQEHGIPLPSEEVQQARVDHITRKPMSNE